MQDSDETDAAKRMLRRELLAERRGLDPARTIAASDLIVARLLDLPELRRPAGTRPHGSLRVLLYAADPDEVRLDALIVSPPPGWGVLLPRVEDGELVVVPHPPGAPLHRGHRGIREPDGDAVDPAEVDVAIVPGVAFTPEGSRLGRGAGMYDRLLPRTAGAPRIGVCLERFVRGRLPVAGHDASVDLVVTDASVRRRTVTAGVGPT